MAGESEPGCVTTRADSATSAGLDEEALRRAVKARLGEAKFGLWFGEGVRLGLDDAGETLEIRAPDPFFRDWIRGHYSESLLEAAESIFGHRPRLAFRIDEEGIAPVQATDSTAVVSPPEPSSASTRDAPSTPRFPAERSDSPASPGTAKAGQHPPVSGESSIAAAPPRRARPLRRLEDFVTGPGNRLAHAAARDMAATAGASFNPLVIHAAVGLGKSHLLEGIAVGLRQSFPALNIIQVTAETFTNSFLEAMRAGNLGGFRGRYRGAGVLIVDDVHFLAAKRATQDEFLHTFNALVDKGAPIVLALDQHPRLVARLTDELATRFLAGMVAKIEAPDLATRRAILKARARTRGIELPEPVLTYIAEHLKASVRELEGALHTVIAHAVLTGKRIDLGLAQSALRDTIRHTVQTIGLRDIEDVVCRMFQISPEALRSDGRSRMLAYPRMLAMYLARKHLAIPYGEIGRHFGGRNHSTVISAEKKIAAWLMAERQTPFLPGFESAADVLAELERTLSAR